MTEEMTWEDPPPLARHQYDWPEIAKQLKRRKGKWLKIFEQDRNTYAVTIRAGGVVALRPEDGFEVSTRNNKRADGQPRLCDLYLRYNPNGTEK